MPAQIFCAPTRAKLIAALRSMPGVWAVFGSSDGQGSHERHHASISGRVRDDRGSCVAASFAARIVHFTNSVARSYAELRESECEGTPQGVSSRSNVSPATPQNSFATDPPESGFFNSRPRIVPGQTRYQRARLRLYHAVSFGGQRKWENRHTRGR